MLRVMICTGRMGERTEVCRHQIYITLLNKKKNPVDIESLHENNTSGASIGYGGNANHCPRLATLTPATGKWCIDWLGSVSFPDRSRSAYQPSMEVSLSKVEGDVRFGAHTFQSSHCS